MSFIFIIIIFSLSLKSSIKEENKYLISISYLDFILLLLIKYITFSLIMRFPQIILVFIIHSVSSLNISILSLPLSKMDFNSL